MSTTRTTKSSKGAASAAGKAGTAKAPRGRSDSSQKPQLGTAGPARRVGRRVASLSQQEADSLVLMLSQAVRGEVHAQRQMHEDGDAASVRNYRRAMRHREICENRIVRALLTEYVK